MYFVNVRRNYWENLIIAHSGLPEKPFCPSISGYLPVNVHALINILALSYIDSFILYIFQDQIIK